MIVKLGELVQYILTCAKEHNANPHTPVYVREGANGPMRQIGTVKMGQDARGQYVVLEVSSTVIH